MYTYWWSGFRDACTLDACVAKARHIHMHAVVFHVTLRGVAGQASGTRQHACMQANDEFAEAKDGYRDDAELEYGSSSDDEPAGTEAEEQDPLAVIADTAAGAANGGRDDQDMGERSGAADDDIEAARGGGSDKVGGDEGPEEGGEEAAAVEDDEGPRKAKRARRQTAKSGHVRSSAAAKFAIGIKHACAPRDPLHVVCTRPCSSQLFACAP